MTAHVLGSAVIGSDPQAGVVDERHRVFGTRTRWSATAPPSLRTSGQPRLHDHRAHRARNGPRPTKGRCDPSVGHRRPARDAGKDLSSAATYLRPMSRRPGELLDHAAATGLPLSHGTSVLRWLPTLRQRGTRAAGARRRNASSVVAALCTIGESRCAGRTPESVSSRRPGDGHTTADKGSADELVSGTTSATHRGREDPREVSNAARGLESSEPLVGEAAGAVVQEPGRLG